MLIGQDVLPPFGLKEARPVYHADALVVFAENEQVKTDAAIPEQSFRKRNAFDPAAAKKFWRTPGRCYCTALCPAS